MSQARTEGWEHPVDVVILHPRVSALGRTAREQRRVDAFARDLARWLYGVPPSELGALARVVVAVLRRELADTRRVCRDRPLLAVEAAARATQALWPLLRWDEPEPPEPEEPDPDDAAGEDGGEEAVAVGPSEEGAADEPQEDEAADGPDGEGEAGAADQEGEGSGDGDGPERQTEVLTPEEVLAALADLPQVDDPELQALAERLRERLGGDEDAVEVGATAADLLQGAGEAATEGALQTDRVARHLEQFLPGVGWSNAPGQLEMTLLERLEGLTALLAQLEDLRKLADHLGRLEESTRRKGPQEGGREEVVGVRLGGDFANALPSELGLLGDPDTEDLFYQRFLERRLVTLELEGAGDEGVAMGDKRGPVVACIDTSASMEGAPEMAAKALVLAVCRQVVPKGRLVHLILFGGPGESTEIRIRRGLGGLEGLIDFLLQSFHSGTDFDGPLLRAMDLLEEQDLHNADVLVVTDGLCRANAHVIERVDKVRAQTGARVWSVVLGRRDVRGVAPFSDEVWQLDPTDAADAVGLVQRFGRSLR